MVGKEKEKGWVMDILGLLKRLEWDGYDGCGHACPECGNGVAYIDHFGEKQGGYHQPDCELKAAIDELEAGRLVFYMRDHAIAEGPITKAMRLKKEQGE